MTLAQKERKSSFLLWNLALDCRRKIIGETDDLFEQSDPQFQIDD